MVWTRTPKTCSSRLASSVTFNWPSQTPLRRRPIGNMATNQVFNIGSLATSTTVRWRGVLWRHSLLRQPISRKRTWRIFRLKSRNPCNTTTTPFLFRVVNSEQDRKNNVLSKRPILAAGPLSLSLYVSVFLCLPLYVFLCICITLSVSVCLSSPLRWSIKRQRYRSFELVIIIIKMTMSHHFNESPISTCSSILL